MTSWTIPSLEKWGPPLQPGPTKLRTPPAFQAEARAKSPPAIEALLQPPPPVAPRKLEPAAPLGAAPARFRLEMVDLGRSPGRDPRATPVGGPHSEPAQARAGVGVGAPDGTPTERDDDLHLFPPPRPRDRTPARPCSTSTPSKRSAISPTTRARPSRKPRNPRQSPSRKRSRTSRSRSWSRRNRRVGDDRRCACSSSHQKRGVRAAEPSCRAWGFASCAHRKGDVATWDDAAVTRRSARARGSKRICVPSPTAFKRRRA